MGIYSMLAEAVFCLDLNSADVDGAVEELLGLMDASLAGEEAAGVLRDLKERERLRRAAGDGEFALLHAFVPRRGAQGLAFGRSKAGLNSEGSDSPPVHFVCLVLISPGQSPQGFRCLNSLAVLLREPMVRTQMLWAEGVEEVLAVCRESDGARRRALVSWLKERLEGLIRPSAPAGSAEGG